MNRGQTPEVTGVERLQQIERFSASHFADENPIGPMPKRRAYEVRNRHGWQRRLLSEGRLRAACFESDEVRFLQMNLRGLFDDDDAVAVRDACRERVQQRRFARARPAGDEHVLLPCDGTGQFPGARPPLAWSGWRWHLRRPCGVRAMSRAS